MSLACRPFRPVPTTPRWPSLCPFLLWEAHSLLRVPGHLVCETSSVCVSAALPSQGELGGGKPPPPEPDPAVEPAEPVASGAEHGEQGAVPRGAEAVHVRGVGRRLSAEGPWRAGRSCPGAWCLEGEGTDRPSGASLPGFPWNGSRFLREGGLAFVCFSRQHPLPAAASSALGVQFTLKKHHSGEREAPREGIQTGG